MGETLRSKLAWSLHQQGLCRGGEYATSECHCLEATENVLLPIIRKHAVEVARANGEHQAAACLEKMS